MTNSFGISPETGTKRRDARAEIQSGDRFQFGRNWSFFLECIDDTRITEAKASLSTMLETDSFAGKTFADVGSGSGLFSLAARSLGARVHSFDFDPSSVWCTGELRRRYYPEDEDWAVEQGSALDQDYVHKLGQFDFVYSWGVLHHTGEMWRALDLVAHLVKPGGMLFIALYNDQGRKSRIWTRIKKAYCRLPRLLRPVILFPSAMVLWGPRMLLDCLTLRPFTSWRTYYRRRGMSPWRDIVDWVGGYPFETAKPDAIFEFYRKKGFVLQRLRTTTGLGNNEFVFHLSVSGRADN